MKILHLCLAAIYVDNHGYQENILPKMHKLQGHEVMIVASTETFIENQKLGYITPSSYKTADDIPLVRLPYVSWIPSKLVRKLRLYTGLSEVLRSFQPDCIFLHDIQFISIKNIAAYVKENKNVVVYADGHTDFINSARNWVSRNILHKLIYKWCAKRIEPHIKKFWGTLPARVNFFKDVYNIAPEKVDLLVMGGDMTNIDFENKENIRISIRKKYHIDDKTFLIITGGKIDELKNIHLLIQSIDKIAKDDIKLLVFGNVNEELKPKFDVLFQSKFVKYVGWINSNEVYDYFLASDLAFFPGTHSVLWEQAIAAGLPGVFKKWEGMQHVDVGGNVSFLDDVSVKTIEEMILKIYNNPNLYNKMKEVSETAGISTFSYYKIAQRAIGLNDN